MKFLAVLFFAGLGLAAAVPFFVHDGIEVYNELEEKHFAFADDDVKTELGKKLKERFDEILEKFKETLEKGRGIKEEYIDQLKEIRQKLKDLKVDIGDHAKDVIEKLKEKVKDYWQKILEKLKPDKDVFYAEEDPKTELAKKLKKHFEEILEKVTTIVDNGNALREDLLLKLKEIRQKLQDMKIDIGDHAKELLGKLKDKIKDYWKRIFDKLNPASAANVNPEDLGNKFHDMIEKLRQALRDRKLLGGGFISKLKELREQMRQKNIPIGGKTKEIIENLKEKSSLFWRRILDRLSGNNKRSVDDLSSFSDEGNEVANNLRKRFEELLEKLKDAIVNHKFIGFNLMDQLRDVFIKCKGKNIPLGDKAKELIEELRGKASGLVKTILDYISKNWPSVNESDVFSFSDEGDEVAKNFRKRFEEILEKIKDAIANHKFLGFNVLNELRDVFTKIKAKNIHLGDKAKELIDELRAKASGLVKTILDYISENWPSVKESNDGLIRSTGAEELQNKFHDMLEKIKEAIKDRKLLGGGFISKLKELREKMRENNVPIGGKAKELIENLKEKATGFWRRVLDRLSGNNKRSIDEFDDILSRSTGAEELQNKFHDMLEKIKEAIQDHKLLGGGFISKLKELREKMRENNVPIGGKAKELIENLKEKATGFWRRVLDRLSGNNKRSIDDSTALFVEEEDEKNEVIKKLKDRFEELLEKFKDAIEKGKEVKKETIEKLKEIRKTLKDFNVDVGNRAKLLIERLKEEAKDYWKKILDTLKE